MATKLPYRIIDPALLRKAWSAGRTFYEPKETKPPRAIEKPVDEMTLADLISTQNMEPLSESRRSFLQRGEGVSSLDRPQATAEGATITLLDIVGTPAPKCLVDVIDDSFTEDDALDELEQAEHDAKRYPRWMYTVPDLTTQRQILWEQERAQDGPSLRLKVVPAENGSLDIQNIGRGIPQDMSFAKIATSALRSLFASVGRVETYTELRAAIDQQLAMARDPVAAAFYSPDWTEERERYLAPDDRIAHSSYEALDDDGDPIVHHRSPRKNPDWETWHHALRRNSSDPMEIGFDLCSNTELESLLGVTEWDEYGNALDDERVALLAAG